MIELVERDSRPSERGPLTTPFLSSSSSSSSGNIANTLNRDSLSSLSSSSSSFRGHLPLSAEATSDEIITHQLKVVRDGLWWRADSILRRRMEHSNRWSHLVAFRNRCAQFLEFGSAWFWVRCAASVLSAILILVLSLVNVYSDNSSKAAWQITISTIYSVLMAGIAMELVTRTVLVGVVPYFYKTPLMAREWDAGRSRPGVQWRNIIDAVLVIFDVSINITLLTISLANLTFPDDHFSDNCDRQCTLDRTLSSFGSLGVARLCLFITYNKQLDMVINGMRRAIKTTMLMFGFLFLVVYAFGIVAFIFNNPAMNSDRCLPDLSKGLAEPKDTHCLVYHSSVFASWFTMFQVMTGDEWSSVARESSHNSWGLLSYAFFTFYQLFMSFIIFNIITGIVVQAIQSAGEEKKEKELEEELRQMSQDSATTQVVESSPPAVDLSLGDLANKHGNKKPATTRKRSKSATLLRTLESIHSQQQQQQLNVSTMDILRQLTQQMESMTRQMESMEQKLERLAQTR